MSTNPTATPPRLFTGRSVEELIPQIERELGRDAIVTRQRSGLNGGLAGFFQRPFVEIEACPGHPRVDLYDEPTADPTRPPRSRHAELRSPDAPTAMPARVLDRFAAALANAELAERESADTVSGCAQSTGAESATAAGAETKAPGAEAPATEATLGEAAAVGAEAVAVGVEMAATPAAEPLASTGEVAEVRARLLDRGLQRELADELVAIASARALALTPPDAPFAAAVDAVLRRRIPSPAPWSTTGTSIALVGPGGAGKTSACAALAAAHRERGGSRVACASILAADEGEHSLLLSPHLLEPTPIEDERVSLALSAARRDGLLLLDTPTLPATDEAEVALLARLLARLAPDEVVIALPATYGARAAQQLLDAMAPLKPTAIAITHARETDQLGAAVGAACATGLAPTFLLDQRRGGEGLLHTDPADLAARLLG